MHRRRPLGVIIIIIILILTGEHWSGEASTLPESSHQNSANEHLYEPDESNVYKERHIFGHNKQSYVCGRKRKRTSV